MLVLLTVTIFIFQLTLSITAFTDANKGLKGSFLKFSLKDVTNTDDVKLSFTSESDSI